MIFVIVGEIYEFDCKKFFRKVYVVNERPKSIEKSKHFFKLENADGNF